jgi:hypothetical protein
MRPTDPGLSDSVTARRKSAKMTKWFMPGNRVAVIAVLLAIGLVGGLVASQMGDSAAEAASAPPPVSRIQGSMAAGGENAAVKVRGARRRTRVSSTGLFSLRGSRLGGSRTLVFKKDRRRFTMSVSVPAGATLVLSGVTLSEDGTAEAEEEGIEVEGTLTDVNCGVAPPTLTISNGATSVTMSFDPATTELENEEDEEPITSCEELASFIGSPAKAEGVVNDDGSIAAEEVEVGIDEEDDDDGAEVEFHGVVQATNCPSSITVRRTGDVDVLVNILETTEIEIESGEDESAGSCADLVEGLEVEVEGELLPDGSVNAEEVEVEEGEAE